MSFSVVVVLRFCEANFCFKWHWALLKKLFYWIAIRSHIMSTKSLCVQRYLTQFTSPLTMMICYRSTDTSSFSLNFYFGVEDACNWDHTKKIRWLRKSESLWKPKKKLYEVVKTLFFSSFLFLIQQQKYNKKNIQWLKMWKTLELSSERKHRKNNIIEYNTTQK